MGDKTGINWTDATWNPVRGCSRVSKGCMRCYAERVAARFSGPGQPYEGLVSLRREPRGPRTERDVALWNGVVRLVPEHLADPMRWRRPRRIFVNSMSDLFHESLTNEQIAAVFGVMAACPQHTFQVLTKRAKRMREWFEWAREDYIDSGNLADMLAPYFGNEAGDGSSEDQDRQFEFLRGKIEEVHKTHIMPGPWPLPNVWLGVSVENQAAADERIPELLATPAAVRFLSCEPLLGPLDLDRWVFDRSAAIRRAMSGPAALNREQADDYIAPMAIDWVIAGCESGSGARPCNVEWLRSLRDQCVDAGVPFWLKQASDVIAEVTTGTGSKRKPGGVIDLPYLDGVQHAAMPGIP